jgi:nanoRNase/pAp phosphatase (c-di-AMP/oligoRNAs hydrolase)
MIRQARRKAARLQEKLAKKQAVIDQNQERERKEMEAFFEKVKQNNELNNTKTTK